MVKEFILLTTDMGRSKTEKKKAIIREKNNFYNGLNTILLNVI